MPQMQQGVYHPLLPVTQVQPLWCVSSARPQRPAPLTRPGGVPTRGPAGYSYCHSCSDFQALMPRRAPGSAMSDQNNTSGYDPMRVCAFCIEMLQSKLPVHSTGSGKWWY